MLNTSNKKSLAVLQTSIAIMTILLIVVYVVATETNYTARLEVRVLSMNSSKCCCVYDTLTIEISYWGSASIKPGFIIVTGEEGVNKMWSIVEGPSILKPGDKAVYIIEAPSCSCAIRPSRHYRVIIVDTVNGVILSASSLYSAPHLRC